MKAREICFRSEKQDMVAKLGNRDEKRDFMRRNGELVEGVYIDDNLTKREREVQQRLKRMAVEERERRGEYIKVRYGKIFLGG